MDTLAEIPEIGIAAQDRLGRAGIKSCSQLADTSPQEIRIILGYLAQGFDLQRWIMKAQAFVREQAD